MNLRLAAVVMSLCVAACDRTGETPEATAKGQGEGTAMVKKLSTIDSGYSSSVADWTDFLNCWATKFGSKGAQADEIVATTMSSELPVSYRHFVQATGGRGWQLPGAKSRSGHGYSHFLPLKKTGLLKGVDPTTWKAWNDNRLQTRVSDRDYYNYTRTQDLTKFRDEHLDSLVLVGDMDNGAVVLLNPGERSKDGEWEAWYLSTRLAGALRFRSFAELAQMLYFADATPERDLWSYSDGELGASCAGRLRINQR